MFKTMWYCGFIPLQARSGIGKRWPTGHIPLAACLLKCYWHLVPHLFTCYLWLLSHYKGKIEPKIFPVWLFPEKVSWSLPELDFSSTLSSPDTGPDHCFGARWLFVMVGWPVHRRTFSSSPGPYTPDFRSSLLPAHDIKTCLQTLPHVPWRTKPLRVKNCL